MKNITFKIKKPKINDEFQCNLYIQIKNKRDN
jgi:hypothetical protein